ncbi:hypothetical protein ACFWE3_10900 [Mycobacteriaceae bacterium NPDC060252]
MSADLSTWGAEVCVDRVGRAGEIRAEIDRGWRAYWSTDPRQFELATGEADGQWTLVLHTLTPTPLRLSTLFGEWLYLLRAALDGIAYYCAVKDSGKDPPPNARRIYFPIKESLSEYDAPKHRESLIALSEETFDLLRKTQPFNTSFGFQSHPLWWIEELSIIDRHRRGHALEPHVVHSRVGLQEPLKYGKSHLQLDKPVPLDESGPMPILDVQAPPEFSKWQVMEHMEIGRALTGYFDVTRWKANAAHPMDTLTLFARMALVERHVLDIVTPAADGTAFP